MNIASFFTGKKKILIIEDDVVLRSALADKFQAGGMATLQAGDAHEVLALMSTENPDALVLDLILPLKDGISLLEELRQAGYDLPVVILSNLLGSEDLRADATRLDAKFYNKSDTSLDVIVEAVREKLAQ
jgi:DNA-binding response OmpR family regulator